MLLIDKPRLDCTSGRRLRKLFPRNTGRPHRHARSPPRPAGGPDRPCTSSRRACRHGQGLLRHDRLGVRRHRDNRQTLEEKACLSTWRLSAECAALVGTVSPPPRLLRGEHQEALYEYAAKASRFRSSALPPWCTRGGFILGRAGADPSPSLRQRHLCETLAELLGDKLGCGGHRLHLRRESVGPSSSPTLDVDATRALAPAALALRLGPRFRSSERRSKQA